MRVSSMRVTFRLNPEYDQELIDKLKFYQQRNLSKFIRKILRDNIDLYEMNENNLVVCKKDNA